VLLNYVAGVSKYNYTDFLIGPSFAVDAPQGLFVNAKSKINNLKDLIAEAKANPGKIKAATEVGAYTYFEFLAFQKATGIKLNLVDVGSNSAKATALLGGHIDLMPNSYGTTKGYIDSGDFVCLGIPSEKRMKNVATAPTFIEQGVKFTFPELNFAFYFPKKTPKSVISKFEKVSKQLVASPEVQTDLEKVGMIANYRDRKETVKFIVNALKLFKSLK
jgi:tripartite-type tricarboxylate transporter receptor subunit TctC